jgi:hypothetical protein
MQIVVVIGNAKINQHIMNFLTNILNFFGRNKGCPSESVRHT